MHYGKPVHELFELGDLVLNDKNGLIMSIFFQDRDDLVDFLVAQSGEGLIEYDDLWVCDKLRGQISSKGKPIGAILGFCCNCRNP